jgi:hypothetical protein
LNSQIENLTQAESGLADTDLVEEVNGLQQGLLRFETSIRLPSVPNPKRAISGTYPRFIGLATESILHCFYKFSVLIEGI